MLLASNVMKTDVKISARNLQKFYDTPGGEIHAVKDFNLEIRNGEFLPIVGPSGCGKSTFLRMVAGLESITAGEIEVTGHQNVPSGNHRSSNIQPENSVVFQEYALFPWKTVRDNIAFGLEMRGVGKKERHCVAQEWIHRVGLEGFADLYPHQISGGMQQRVSIARALANDPQILLMDEPLGALDAQTRTILQEELLALWEADKKTVVYITHSLEEAVLMGDRVVLMTARPGTVKEIFEIDLPRPRTLATATTQAFSALTTEIWQSLRVEVEQAMALQKQSASIGVSS